MGEVGSENQSCCSGKEMMASRVSWISQKWQSMRMLIAAHVLREEQTIADVRLTNEDSKKPSDEGWGNRGGSILQK